MKVRSKLSLASALGLLMLLAVIYVGGRRVVVYSFRQAEKRLALALPGVRHSLRRELDQISFLAAAAATRPEVGRLLAGGAPPRDDIARYMAGMDLDLWLVADAAGNIAAASLRHPDKPDGIWTPDSSIAVHLRPGGRLLPATVGERRDSVSGLLMLAEGPMLVASAPIAPLAATNAAARSGVLLLGRAVENEHLLLRMRAGLPEHSKLNGQLEILAAAGSGAAAEWPGRARETAAPHVLAVWSAQGPLEVRVPIYDIYGRPAVAIRIALGSSLQSLSDLALAWMALLVAATGVLFVVPLFVVQGRTVLNPLTRLVADLQSLGKGVPDGRRLGWRRRDEFGAVTNMIDAMLDAIDEEHRKVTASEAHTRALLAANPDLIFVFDRHGNIIDAGTPGDERMKLFFPSPVKGRNIQEVDGVRPEVATRLISHLATAIDSGLIQLFEYSMKKPSGAMFWAEARIVRLSGDRALVIVRDITARRHAQRDRARLEAKVARWQKVESLGVLAGGIAHDYNNILTAMLGHVDVAMREAQSPTGRAAIEDIRQAMLRASALTRQMLAFAGQGAFTFQPTNLNSLLHDLLRIIRGSLSRQAELSIALHNRIPLVEADGTQIWQVVMNLILNASEALAGSVGRISLSATHVTPSSAELDSYLAATPLPQGDYVLIEVGDTGHGMDARTVERIFDPFFTTKAVGRGLGLSSVLGIVRAHNGGISVTSTPGQGTVFRVLLPVARNERGELIFDDEHAAATPQAAVAPAAPAAASPDAAKGTQVLVVDDDKAIRHLIEVVLKTENHTALAAASGEQALSLFTQHQEQVGLAVIDASMPGMNGVQTLNELRALNPRLPAIIMSGYGAVDTGALFAGHGVSGFLVKPFASADLLNAVRTGLAESASAGRAGIRQTVKEQ